MIFFLFIINPITAASEINNPLQKVLVVYNQRNVFGYQTDYVKAFGLLLKHFHTDVHFIDIRDYRSGEIEKYQVTFYLGLTKDSIINENFLEDAVKTKQRLCWMGFQLPKLLEHRPELGVSFLGISTEYIYQIYHNQQYNQGIKIPDILLKSTNSKTRIWAEISNGHQKYPYALNVDNVWLFSRFDMAEGPGYLIMADLLHEIFFEHHKPVRQAFIRIEDIHPFTDPKKLKAITQVIIENRLPFMMAVIPAYVNQKNKITAYLSNNPALIEVIQEGIRNKGSVILHGFTHQNGTEETGEGFEFWDNLRNKPLKGNNATLIREHLNQGVLECVRNRIFPLAFEPPHYAISQSGYIESAKDFSTLVAQIQSSDEGFTTNAYPYVLYDTYCAQFIVPENLSYVSTEDIDPIAPIRKKAMELKIVRDSMAGVFFHSYVDSAYLKEIIDLLQANGYQFFDLRSLPNSVSLPNIKIENDGERIQWQLQGLKNETFFNHQKSFAIGAVSYLIWGIVILVGAVCASFLLIYLRMRRQEAASLFEKEGERS